MTSLLKAESVIRGMIHTIGSTCTEKGISITNAVISAVVKGALLSPETTIDVEASLSKDEIDKIVQKCVDLIVNDELSMKTVRAQVTFTQAFKAAADIDRARLMEVENVMQDIEAEIFDARCFTREEFEALYRKVVSSILLRSNMGAATDISVVKETTAALESVLPPEELGTFIKLSRQAKREQLRELGVIVMGIRLFNRACDKGGHSIPQLRADTSTLLESCVSDLSAQFAILSEYATKYAAKLTDGVEDAALKEVLQTLAAHALQHILYFQRIEREVSGLVELFSRSQRQFALRLERLITTISGSQAVSTDQVFPQFIELGTLWQTMQAANAAATAYKGLIAEMGSSASLHVDRQQEELDAEDAQVDNAFQLFMHTSTSALKRDLSLLKGERPSADEAPASLERGLHSTDFKQFHPTLSLLEAPKTHNFEQIPLQFAGLCVVSLVESGALIPARREIGLFQRGNVFYGVFSRDRGIKFAEKPDKYLQDMVLKGRLHFELIELLSLHSFLSQASLINSAPTEVAVKCDSGSQTELHPVAENIDKSYEWNEWELRRKALKLANLRQKKTHSTQTNKSHFRRENQTQVYLPKTQSTQTRRDAYTNTSKPVTYMRGLRGPRGPKATPHQVVDLTLKVGGLALEPQKAKLLPKSMHKGGVAGRKCSSTNN